MSHTRPFTRFREIQLCKVLKRKEVAMPKNYVFLEYEFWKHATAAWTLH